MRRHESHVSCVCIAGFSACGCQNTMEVGHTGTGWRYVCWLGEHQPCRVTPVVFRLSRIGFHQALVASLSFNLPNQNRPCVGGLKETAGEEAPQALWMGMELEIYRIKKQQQINARLMAFAPSLALDPTFGIHYHKTLDTAQPCHLLKPNRKPSSSHSISILTNISTQFLLQSLCVCVFACVFVVCFLFCFCYYIILYVNCFGRTMLYMCTEYHIRLMCIM